jgi:hypothetical protein
MVFEYLVTDKGCTDVTSDKSFGALRGNVFREVIHMDIFVTGKAFGLVVVIIHMTGHFGFQHGLLTFTAYMVKTAGFTMNG